MSTITRSICKSLLLCTLAGLSAFALADPPSRVGRISLIQGQVDFRNTNDEERAMNAAVNWPVTSLNVITAARGARAELRVGSTAVRIEADSELEISQLDDQAFKLNLHYGSANVRIKNGDMTQDFELRTAQGRILMLEPSNIRIDADRAPDVTSVSVFSGMTRFEGLGSNLIVRSGRRLDIGDGNIRTTAYARDPFDEWTLARDRADEQSISAQYVSTETTGYEDLDRSGEWRVTAAYGPIWYPTIVPAGWAPYRHGRWTWVEPWGWTWVDNAAWGYAPSHYGRWMWFDQRWCWTPGRMVAHPVWAPAVVGWVGGDNWNVRFSTGQFSGVGWFPLAPHERYVPHYKTSPGYLDRVNMAATAAALLHNSANAADRTRPDHYRNRDEHNGVTVVPHNQFTSARTMVVDIAPKVLVPPTRFPASVNPTPPPIPRPAATMDDFAAKTAIARTTQSSQSLQAARRPDRRDARSIGARPAAVQRIEPAPVGVSTQNTPTRAPDPAVVQSPTRSDLFRHEKPESMGTAVVNAPARVQRRGEPALVAPPPAHEYERLSVRKEIPAAASTPPVVEEQRRQSVASEAAHAMKNAEAHQRERVVQDARASREESAPPQKSSPDREEQAPPRGNRNEGRSLNEHYQR